jgi:predicted nucleic acid-binding protein
VLFPTIDETSSAAGAAAEWISVQSVSDTLAVQLLREELDAGESEAVILAKELPADLILIDERAATRRARALGLTTFGTLGVLLAAKQAGLIVAVKPLMEQLRDLDFHMSIDLYKEVLNAADERNQD